MYFPRLPISVFLNSPSNFSQAVVAIPFHFTQKRFSFLGASHPIFDIGEKWDSQAVQREADTPA